MNFIKLTYNMPHTKKNKYFYNTTIITIISITTIVSAGILCLYFYKFGYTFSEKQSEWADFGNYVGGTITPIISFFALLALLYTIKIQSIELLKTTTQLSKQSEILDQQKFESTFFSLLDQHNKVFDKLQSLESKKYTDIFDEVLSQSKISSARKKLEENNMYCGHYFRTLYQLLKFIATNVQREEKDNHFKWSTEDLKTVPVADNEKMYSNIVRGFLDYDTVQILAINCACEDIKDSYYKYRLLLERYAFLEHMPFKTSAGTENILLMKTKDIYDKKAFGDSDFI